MPLYPGASTVRWAENPARPVQKPVSDTPGITSKIMAISLCGKQPYTGQAAFTGESLVFTEITPVTETFAKWKKKIIEDVKTKVADKWIVSVEEKTDIIARHATQHFDFEDVNSLDKKINLYRALDMYFAMKAMGTLVLPDHLRQNDIRESKINIQQDEKGRTKYLVNWPEFTGGNRVILLAVMAAQYEPISDKYLSEMFENMGTKRNLPDDPFSRLMRMMEKLNMESIL